MQEKDNPKGIKRAKKLMGNTETETHFTTHLAPAAKLVPEKWHVLLQGEVPGVTMEITEILSSLKHFCCIFH